jgi:ElaA protein
VSQDLHVGRARADELAACREIRLRVFVEEQGVPLELEIDEHEAAAVHLLARVGGQAVGTARLRVLGRDAKAERVAVLAAYRELGVGRALMRAIETEAAGLGLARVVLNAQVPVIPFYERLGYAAFGPRFDEAGIPHRRMTRELRSKLNPPSRSTGGGAAAGTRGREPA